jgi:NADPH-dependent 2,4-dienoyl-CoA reductase/sulfur reductase-like enzyme/rhodanese-related sulfurtransferase
MTQESNSPRIVIVGGVAGGGSAAARARRHSESAEIVLIERGPDVSFANCGLPYHIGGEIKERSALAVQTPDSLRAILNLDVRAGTEVTSIDREAKAVTMHDIARGTDDTLAYDKLVLAPGASPLRPPLAGIDDPRVMTLRNLDDMDGIKQAAAGVEEVAVIGAGFIGLEMAEQLVHIGKRVTVIELLDQVLPPLDPEIAEPLANELRSKGVKVILSDGVDRFEPSNEAVGVALKSGTTVQAGLVILSIGVRPESGLAKDAGLELGSRGDIVVDEYQRSSDPDIYAAGDVCETADLVTGTRTSIPLGGPANRQGRTAADHIFLGDKALPYPGSLGTAIVRVFDLAAGITGWSEKRLTSNGIEFQTVVVNAPQHASYFPGATPVIFKLLWSPEDGRVLGAQAVGRDGVDKRLDVIATAIRGRLTIDDLAHLELSYAPPFGSAKDVVNIAGFAAGNIRDGLLKPVNSLADAAGEQIIDVRPPKMVEKKPVHGAKNIPLGQLRGRLDEIDGSRPVYTICQVGKTSYFAARILANNGFDARSILGGALHQL